MALGSHIAGEMAVDRSSSFATAYGRLPPLAEGNIRLHIYRTQAFGGYPRPIAVVDGSYVGAAGRPLLPHRSAFVLDTSARQLDLWLFTIEETRAEDMGRKISVSPRDGPTFFFRLGLGPTFTFLEQVAESEAMKEMRSLTFTGYLTLH